MRPPPAGTSTDARSSNLARTQGEITADDVRASLTIAGIPDLTHGTVTTRLAVVDRP
jgi:hypothetical protein